MKPKITGQKRAVKFEVEIVTCASETVREIKENLESVIEECCGFDAERVTVLEEHLHSGDAKVELPKGHA